MEDKVTSYETSKRLHELGFDSDRHCGWWEGWSPNDAKIYHSDDKALVEVVGDIPVYICECGFKAYDCHDLLNALRKMQEENSIDDFYLHYRNLWTVVWTKDLDDTESSDIDLAEALAKAIIEILEEKQS